MELCKKCNRMTAERDHYTGEVICYSRFCVEQTSEFKKSETTRTNSSERLVASKRTMKDSFPSR